MISSSLTSQSIPAKRVGSVNRSAYGVIKYVSRRLSDNAKQARRRTRRTYKRQLMPTAELWSMMCVAERANDDRARGVTEFMHEFIELQRRRISLFLSFFGADYGL